MDIVYTLKPDPRSRNRQLIYSLRSVEKYLRGYGKVFVIGIDPGLKNVTYIPANDHKSPAINIKDKLLIACNEPDISDDFLYMADDYYFLKEQDIATHPTYSSGLLFDLARIQKTAYKQYVLRTAHALNGGVNFNVHAPMPYNKEKLIAAVNKVDWSVDGLGYLVKSLYGNLSGITGTPLADLKIGREIPVEEMKAKLVDRPCFSTGKEWECKGISVLLSQLYPEKSTFEP